MADDSYFIRSDISAEIIKCKYGGELQSYMVNGIKVRYKSQQLHDVRLFGTKDDANDNQDLGTGHFASYICKKSG